MKITITVEVLQKDGQTLEGTLDYEGDYYDLHARDWSEKVRGQLDTMQDLTEGKV